MVARVFVVGDINIDILCNYREIPDIGEEAHLDSVNISIGGNAANFAVALGKLGERPELFAVIGNDFACDYLLDTLRGSGVKANLKRLDKTNGYSIVFVNQSGERFILSNKGASGEITVGDLEGVVEKTKDGDIVYVGGYFHLRKLHEGFPDFLRRIKRKKGLVFFDMCFDKHGTWMESLKGLLGYIDLVFMNEKELSMISGGDPEALPGLGIKQAVVKLGKKGSMYCSGNQIIREEAFKVRAVDTTGAGDVFNAGFVYGYAKGLTPERCLKLGNFVAGKKVQHHGIVVPKKEEVERFMRGLG